MQHRPSVRAAAALVACLLATAPLDAQAQAVNPRASAAMAPAMEAAVEALVASWIERNPEAVLRAVEAARAARTAPDLADPMDGLIGPAGGDTTIVAFIDRGSPSSRAALPVLAAAASGDPALRVIVKELPLGSEAAVLAATTAVAARARGGHAFRAFEAALVAVSWPPGPAELASAAAAAGLAPEVAAGARADPTILDYLRRTRDLATSIGVTGTPAFVVGRRGIVGLRTVDEIRAAVAEARAAGAGR